MKGIFIPLMVTCSLLASSAYAEMYQLNVTRKSKNIYSVTGKDTIVQTKYCYEYAYSEDAVLNTNGYPALIFTNNGQKCDVKGLYSLSNPKAGTYKVSVSQEEDDWYEIMGSDTFIRTTICLELALGSSSILKVDSNGYGKLIFDRGNSCSVEGLYTKMRL
jgi:hypothetical protein